MRSSRYSAKKTGALDVVVTRDIEALAPDKLAEYDVLVLNNNCPKGPRRNLFLDEMERNKKYAGLTKEQREAKAKALEKIGRRFRRRRQGDRRHSRLADNGEQLEGVQRNDRRFVPLPSAGARSDASAGRAEPSAAGGVQRQGTVHPRRRTVSICGPYDKLNFRPLLVMKADKLKDKRGEAAKKVRYVAWIKPHGQGPGVFSPRPAISPKATRARPCCGSCSTACNTPRRPEVRRFMPKIEGGVKNVVRR